MLSRYEPWKYILLLIVIILGAIYALPNLYPDVPVIQISGADASIQVRDHVLKKAEKALEEADISYSNPQVNESSAMIQLASKEAQLKAKDIVESVLEKDYVVALNLAATTPTWLLNLGAGPMKLGLDLSGGVHFLLEVDLEKALKQRLNAYSVEIKDQLRENRLYYKSLKSQFSKEDQKAIVEISFKKLALRDSAYEKLKSDLGEFRVESAEIDGNPGLRLTLQPQKIKEIQDHAISQNLVALRNRVNEIGVAEPLVQRQGLNRIVVELPGIQDTSVAKRIIGRTANLEFRLVDMERTANSNRIPPTSEVFEFKGDPGTKTVLKKRLITTGDTVLGAQSGYDENGVPQVNITLDGQGGKQMQRATTDNVGNQMAVVFVEQKTNLKRVVENGETKVIRTTREEKYVINQATIQAVLGNRFRITGLDSPQESSELALLLRAGALAAPMYFVEESTVGPSLGQENINAGLLSVQFGFLFVLVFMLVYYKIFGFFANIALVLNLILLLAVLSLMSATLTLPGIAGVVLTVGMAVDANVLIFSRIREELALGRSPSDAIEQGYDRAFTTILDANITTLIVAIILFAVGSGAIKGFAVTLSVGIITSMFTAIVGTRAMVSLRYGTKKIERLSI